jgi:hypothetical protein
MDLYQGTFVLANQKHDFSPGIPASGLFWTQPIPQDNVAVHFGNGIASVNVSDLAEEDAGNVLNALQGGPTTPATVSFEMRWAATGAPIALTDPVHRFTGEFFISDFHIQWSAKSEGFSFESDPAETSVSVSSVLGRERNGVFFAEDGEGGD